MEHEPQPDRVARMVAQLAVGERDASGSLCSACASIVGVSGAGLVLLSGQRSLGNVCVSDPATELVEELQYTLGEGPCIDAFRTKVPVLVADLAAVDGRWPAFRQGAVDAGVRAAFGFPLLVGTSCIGALNLFHDRKGALDDEQYADAVAIAHVAGRTVLAWQSTAEHGSVAWQLEQVPAHRAVIHQAAGIISVQTETQIDDALVLLRAHAFAEGRPIGDVAADVVGNTLRFD
ncbi:MAG TPA: GAF and ANTAR domain-containing protein [Acidimicrobiia bacterium]|nr:GAF and ANTAR domain-containing protein [Acidimicrobiia bacterium]